MNQRVRGYRATADVLEGHGVARVIRPRSASPECVVEGKPGVAAWLQLNKALQLPSASRVSVHRRSRSPAALLVLPRSTML